MFEKEAGEWVKENMDCCKTDNSVNQSIPYFDEEERCCAKSAFQDGAEFGNNKANEWHYVKDGDLPKGLPKPVLVAFHNKFSDKIVIDIARYSLELNKWWFIHDLKDLEEDVIAWKEIVFPELKESE